MLLRGLGVARADRSVVILGAGASRGASFCRPGRSVLPPLDADFFRQAQHLDEATYNKYAKPVLEFVRTEYGSRTLPTLEAVFTQLEGFERFIRAFSTRKGRRPVRYQRQLEYLLDLVPAVFRAGFADHTCHWHERLAHALRAGDAVISFNYDALVDRALGSHATGIWDARVGYGLEVRSGAEHWTAGSRPGPFPKEYLRLLKPHGSLHWAGLDSSTQTIRLQTDPYKQRNPQSNLIPPTWDKSILGEWPWKPVWEESSRVLQRARCLIIIGYSVPQTDLMSQALMKSSLSTTELRLLVVVNPDQEARARVIDLAQGAIRPRTRVVELGALQDFALLLDETPGERDRRAIALRMRRQVDAITAKLEDLETWQLPDLESRLDDIEARI